MSILKAYALLDSKISDFSTPFFCRNDAEAIRMFVDLAMDSRSTVSRHSGDFTLHRLAEVNLTNGVFSSEPSVQVYTGNEARIAARLELERMDAVTRQVEESALKRIGGAK